MELGQPGGGRGGGGDHSVGMCFVGVGHYSVTLEVCKCTSLLVLHHCTSSIVHETGWW